MELPSDFSALIAAFEARGVEYLVVGGYAVGAHGRPRATKDLDLWVSGGENLERVALALTDFGVPAAIIGQARSLGDDEVLFFGRSPLRVDLLRSISGVSFDAARVRAVRMKLGDREGVPVIHIDDLIENKRRAGRPQDLADAASLERLKARRASAKR